MERNVKPHLSKSLTLLQQALGSNSTEIISNVFGDIIASHGDSFDLNETTYMKVTSSFTGSSYASSDCTNRIQSKNLIWNLLNMIHDDDESIRNAAYVVLKQISELKSIGYLVNNGLIPNLINKLPTETEANQVLILDIIQSLSALNVYGVLDAGILNMLEKLLRHQNPAIRSNAIKTVNTICLENQGISDASVLVALSELLTDNVYEVQVKALETVLSIVETHPEVLIACTRNLFGQLSQLLRSDIPEIQMNALKIFEVLVRCPQGKYRTLLYIEQVLKYTQATDFQIKKVATNIINAL